MARKHRRTSKRLIAMLVNGCVTCCALVTLTFASGRIGRSAPAAKPRPIRVQPGDDLIAAIEAAPTGATLLVSPGEYRGGAIANNAVTVRADRPAPDDRHAGRLKEPVRITGPIDLRADSVTLDGLLWRDLDAQVLQIRGRRNTIRNCTYLRFGKNNVVSHCGRIAHIKGGDGANAPAEDVLLINNTFFENDRGITWDLKREPPRNVRFWNNIFVGDGSSAIESATLMEADRKLYAEDYNLFYRFTPPREPGRHSIVGQDPQFTAPGERDFQLQPGSPARDAGAREVRADPSRRDLAPEIDKSGAPRPMSDVPDLGAFESAAPERTGGAQ